MTERDTKLLAVVGAQRSGTTMLLEALARSAALEVHQEASAAVMNGFRMVSLERLAAVVAASDAAGVVIKPLDDSQWVDHMLANLDGSRAVWMFRDWRDVVNSSARKWPGHGADIVARFVAGDDAWLDWRAERVAPGTKEAFLALCGEVAAGDDHAGWAAWWWLRNRLFFDLGLDRLAQVVRPLGYEGLVMDPSSWLAQLCAFAGLADADVMAASVHARSVGKSAAPTVPGAVADACDQLFASLVETSALAWRP